MVLSRLIPLGGLLFFLTACSTSPPILSDGHSRGCITPSFSQDSLHLFLSGEIRCFEKSFNQDSLFAEPVLSLINDKISNIEDSSLKEFIINETSPAQTDWIELTNISVSRSHITLDYIIKYNILHRSINDALKEHNKNIAYPLEPLFSNSGHLPTPNEFENTQLLLPCDSIPVPENPLFLPNSPRNYRNGIHRGIDFQANWGTPIRAVESGMVIRSDLHYEEISSDFLEKTTDHSERTGHTPSDLFNHVYLGRAVIIDHGFELVPGYRSISIYAHLSNISPHIVRGYEIKKGEVFGRVGNSGMIGAINGTQKGSHLHVELIIQNEFGEYYLGQGIESDQLYDLLQRIFIN